METTKGIAIIVREQIERLERRYDPENDIIPGAPVVTYADMEILQMVRSLLLAVSNLQTQDDVWVNLVLDWKTRAEKAEARVAELEAALKHEEHEKLTVSELDKSTITWLLERLIIATDLGDKRWKALNEIYEQAAETILSYLGKEQKCTSQSKIS